MPEEIELFESLPPDWISEHDIIRSIRLDPRTSKAGMGWALERIVQEHLESSRIYPGGEAKLIKKKDGELEQYASPKLVQDLKDFLFDAWSKK